MRYLDLTILRYLKHLTFHCSYPQQLTPHDLISAYPQDTLANRILKNLADNPSLIPFWTKQDQILFYKKKLYIPNATSRFGLISKAHNTRTSGHAGILPTYKRLVAYFYWPNIKDVKFFIKTCDLCQKEKILTHALFGLSQPLPITTQIWADISMDFITDLPLSHNFSTIFVMVDRFTKAAHFSALPFHYTSPMVAQTFWDSCGKLHGISKTIVSDRDSIFLSDFWHELFTQQGTTLKYSSAYHPQTDGQTERINRTLNQYLRIFVHEHPKIWFSYLSWAEYYYNTSYQASAHMSPYEAMYGRPPPCFISCFAGASRLEAIQSDFKHRIT